MEEAREPEDMDSRAPESVGEEQRGQPVEVVLSRAKQLAVRVEKDVRLLSELQDAMDAMAAAHRDVQRAFDRAFYPLLERVLRSPLRKHTRIRRWVRRCALAVAVLLLIAALRRRHRRYGKRNHA